MIKRHFALFFLALALIVTTAQAQIIGPCPYNGRYYQRVEGSFTQSEAIASAQRIAIIGGRRYVGFLATMNAANENYWVWQALRQPFQYWLGGIQNRNASRPWSGWNWVSGQVWSWTNWASGQPDDGSGTEDNTENGLQFWQNGTWNDRGTNYRSGFIIEYMPG